MKRPCLRCWKANLFASCALIFTWSGSLLSLEFIYSILSLSCDDSQSWVVIELFCVAEFILICY
jgi:hypothetical protein